LAEIKVTGGSAIAPIFFLAGAAIFFIDGHLFLASAVGFLTAGERPVDFLMLFFMLVLVFC
jgi:hypothetical protein